MLIPTLFHRNERTGAVTEDFAVDPDFHHWEAYELVRGASVRVTTRAGEAVRLEALHLPTPEEKIRHITTPWWREAGPRSTPDAWLWESMEGTDLTDLPDGEWEGLAVGPKIFGNYHNLDEHEIVFYDLIPWIDTLGLAAPAPPALGRTPLNSEDVAPWIHEQDSLFAPQGQTIWGVVWCRDGVPQAKVEARDFLPFNKRKVMEE
jgi:hypothetical protein